MRGRRVVKQSTTPEQYRRIVTSPLQKKSVFPARINTQSGVNYGGENVTYRYDLQIFPPRCLSQPIPRGEGMWQENKKKTVGCMQYTLLTPDGVILL